MRTLYVSDNCPGCHAVLAALGGRSLSGLAVKNVSHDAAAAQELARAGARVVPTLLVPGLAPVVGAQAVLAALRGF